MKKINILALSGLLVILVGCGSTMKVTKEYQPSATDLFSYDIQYNESVVVPEEAIVIMKNRIESELGKRNLLAPSNSLNSKRIEIIFNNYTMRGGVARFGGGIFAGTDIIDTLILVKTDDGHVILSEFVVESTNNTAWGTSQGLIEGHADKIVKYLADGKK